MLKQHTSSGVGQERPPVRTLTCVRKLPPPVWPMGLVSSRHCQAGAHLQFPLTASSGPAGLEGLVEDGGQFSLVPSRADVN